MLSGVLKKLTALSIVILCGLVAVPAAFAQEAVCEGYSKKQTIHRLGGRTAFTRTPVSSPEDLYNQLDQHRAELVAIMDEHGLAHLTDKLYAAVKSGNGLSERNLVRGERFEWMTFRKRSGPEAFGPMCVAAKKTYSAYEIELTEVEEHPAKATCALKVSGGACVEDEIRVDASGSSDGVMVEMMGPGGSKSVVSGGSTTWQGLPAAPGAYSFTAKAQAQGTKKVTTHTFVIPKVCLNLAYIGMTMEEKPGDVDTCSTEAKVDVADCAVSLSVSADPAEVKRRKSIQVDVSGVYDAVTVTFEDEDGNPAEAQDADGNAISELTESGPISFRKAGTYTLKGSAVRCENLPGKCAKQATSDTTVEVKGGAWTARFFGLRLDPDDGKINRQIVRPDGLSERSVLSLDSGVGGGAGLEYHFNDRVGLEGTVLYVPLGSQLFFDVGIDWAQNEDDVEMLAFLIGPNFHLTPDKNVDFYIGPFVGIADLSSTSYRVLGEIQRRSLDADTVFGVQLGLDIPFGESGWAVHLGARYFDMSVETEEDGPEIAADPIGFEAGFAYSF